MQDNRASSAPAEAIAVAAMGVARTRTLAAILTSILAAGMTIGITAPLLSLLIERDQGSAALAGLNSSIGVLAVVFISPFVPRLVRRFGALKVIYAGIALVAAAILIIPATGGLSLWFVFRFLIGVGMGLIWVVSETWLNMVAGDANRGLVAGLYSTILGVGFAAGPMVIAAVGIAGYLPFIVSAGLILISALPLIAARRLAPRRIGNGDHTAWQALFQAPLIMAAVFVCGFIDMSILSLLPVYGLRAGFAQDTSLLMLTVLISGTTIMQLPTGWAADRIGRLRLLVVCVLIGAGCALLLPAILATPALLWPVLFLWGGTTVSLYTLGLALLGERFRGDALPAANAMMVIAYCLGGVAGPPLTGAAMEALGPHAMPLTQALLCAVFAAGIAGAWVGNRLRARPSPR
ncbi:MAG: MFS transporter [Alphaproteobacteria bacterium]|nr:MFS transporter [Alphaproteobacteria bacterium]